MRDLLSGGPLVNANAGHPNRPWVVACASDTESGLILQQICRKEQTYMHVGHMHACHHACMHQLVLEDVA